MDKKKEFEELLRNEWISPVFQPIISLKDGKVLGYEALSRISQKGNIQNIEEVFVLAELFNQTWAVEQLCREKSLASLAKQSLKKEEKIFLNVNPKVIHDKKFLEGFTKEMLEDYDLSPDQVIFEITERNAALDLCGFKSVLEHYRKQGYKIAIDDVGAGYAGLNLICGIDPSYLKIDMELIRDVDKDKIKYAIIKSLVELASLTGIQLIAEGIETKAELEVLIHMGVQYGQGYYIQFPNEKLNKIEGSICGRIEWLNRRKIQNECENIEEYQIGNICVSGNIISPSIKVETLLNEKKDMLKSNGFCVVENGIPLGILTKEYMNVQLGGRYGFSLNQKKKIFEIMENDFLVVDEKTPIHVVFYRAMEREEGKLYDFVVVTQSGQYLGCVSIKKLMEKAMELSISAAKLQNPLTGLPGNRRIEKELQNCVKKARKYSVLYFDIDNFKAYNDVYGFEKGDSILKELGNILEQAVDENDFVGHIGGDDFVVILSHYENKELRRNVETEFKNCVKKYYTKTDREKGYIISTNRKGIKDQFPLMSITTAVVTNEKMYYGTISELTEELAKRKKKGKQKKRLA